MLYINGSIHSAEAFTLAFDSVVSETFVDSIVNWTDDIVHHEQCDRSQESTVKAGLRLGELSPIWNWQIRELCKHIMFINHTVKYTVIVVVIMTTWVEMFHHLWHHQRHFKINRNVEDFITAENGLYEIWNSSCEKVLFFCALYSENRPARSTGAGEHITLPSTQIPTRSTTITNCSLRSHALAVITLEPIIYRPYYLNLLQRYKKSSFKVCGKKEPPLIVQWLISTCKN